jgi:hypothetical protein
MQSLKINCWAVIGLMAMLGLAGASGASAQGNCMSFAEARKAGLTNLRPAASAKAEVEERTGGKVVSFLVCPQGPVYKLTVLQPGGTVTNVTVPAR